MPEAAASAPGHSWRNAGAYAGIRATGRAGLAWELLRRDPTYQACSSDRSIAASGATLASIEPASADEVSRWGLHFLRRCRESCGERPDPLVSIA
jgi:hypothetical protein